MDQRGQISIEFILLAAIVFSVVLIFAVSAADDSELNAVATAVKLGAENSTTQISILNSSQQPVRVTSVNMTGTSNVLIQVKFSRTVTSYQTTILQSIQNSLAASGYSTSSISGNNLNMQTAKHSYTITIVS